MIVLTALLLDFDKSQAFAPERPNAGIVRKRTNTIAEESTRSNTDLNVALSPLNVVYSHENQVSSDLLRRSPRSVDIVSLPSSSRALSVGKRHRNSRMIRPKSLNSSARVEARPASERSEILSREEESIRTTHIRRFREAVRARDDLASHRKRQPTELEWAEACGLSVIELRRVMYEGQQARSILVSANAGLVTSIAKRHHHTLKQAMEAGGGVGTILTLHDMIQEGNLGLIEAAERFEPERGLRFSTYATYWVRQRILRSISDSSRIIRLPAHGEYCT